MITTLDVICRKPNVPTISSRQAGADLYRALLVRLNFRPKRAGLGLFSVLN